MAAATDRRLTDAAAGPAAGAPSPDEVSQKVYRDLMAQIRTDYERGG
jgi:hypothetical protein